MTGYEFHPEAEPILMRFGNTSLPITPEPPTA